MSEIERTYSMDKGMLQIEELSGYVFSSEAFAHTFIIHRDDGDVWPGTITARFIRPDGVTIYINNGQVTMDTASVTLPPECYQAAGRFLLVVFHIVDSVAHVIYAGRGTVIASESGQVVAASGTVDSIEAQINAILNDLSDKVNYANLMAVFARNVGNIEGNIDQFQQTVDGITDALAAANLQALNVPNLLKQNFWTNYNSGDVIYGDAAMISGSSTPYMKSISSNRKVEFDHEPTAEESAGAYRIYHRTAGTDSSGNEWTEAWIVHWLVDDSVSTSCVTLTGDDIVHEEADKVNFTKAIQYNITANTAYGNTETLYYNRGAYELKYDAGNPPAHNWGEIDEMEVGKLYTVSCWGRVISGDGALIKFGWGGQYNNSMGYPSDKSGVSDWKELKSAEWVRLYWTFRFEPSGAYYTETTANGKTTRSFNWCKRVMIGVGRKYTSVIQLCGFRLTEGGLYGNNTVDTLQLNVEQAQEQAGNILSSIAPVENGNTASRNYASGALIVWKGALYKASTAITSGQTLSTSNLTATTLAAELALKANA